jgi:type I restriction enzyme R subunit
VKEALARIKINRLLESAGWRFFAENGAPANIRLEPAVALKKADLDGLGEDFERSARGFVDFLLLDEKGFPFIVLEAKAEDKNPLVGKEQARTYARSLNARFVLLSNGNLHYLWDLESGNPYLITAFPTPSSIEGFARLVPDRNRLVAEPVADDFIALTQRPNFAADPGWTNASERPAFIEKSKLRFLRPYQLRAVHALQRAVKEGRDRFLFEMATGTGKTLVSAAVIKLFLKSRNAQRVLFLVDRLELEEQARKSFDAALKNDYRTVVFKENRDDWRKAEIVVSTIQSFLFDNKYQRLFSPTDFDLVISDEAHRSIGGNARAVFEYFVGYKLGLTATPRDYLRRFDPSKPTSKDPREYERRLLLDTYRTFGCDDGQPTFRYSLVDGVKDGFLVNPIVVDARTQVTTKLLSEEGFVVETRDEDGEDRSEVFGQRDFEKRFFAEGANELFCKTFLENALRDPVSGEIGKGIVFAVSQAHAAKLTQILNLIADKMFPGRYQSDFAFQVTSHVPNAQQFTINFANNNLGGSCNFLPDYKTSKARICVTVGMMTTGYDCEDILNLALMRPIFSPTDFIQIKGRGTRRHDFRNEIPEAQRADVVEPEKKAFKLFDFFANCEFFEEEFNYDETLALPPLKSMPFANDDDGGAAKRTLAFHEHEGEDYLASIAEQKIGVDGMKIDRMFFERFGDAMRTDDFVVRAVEAGEWDRVIDYVNKQVLGRPDEYYSLDKLRRAAAVDRRLGLREILEKIFGLIPRFKSKDELLEEEFAKFVADQKPEDAIPPPTRRCARSSTPRISPSSPPTQPSRSRTTRPCPRNSAMRSRNTSRTTSR